eukprot:1176191-Prorocentrum_minimum.AAC.1
MLARILVSAEPGIRGGAVFCRPPSPNERTPGGNAGRSRGPPSKVHRIDTIPLSPANLGAQEAMGEEAAEEGHEE